MYFLVLLMAQLLYSVVSHPHIQTICKKRPLDITSPNNFICVFLSLDQRSFVSGNGIRPLFIIRPKKAFTSGTDTLDHLLQMDLRLS
jgi:hypothetical protein